MSGRRFFKEPRGAVVPFYKALAVRLGKRHVRPHSWGGSLTPMFATIYVAALLTFTQPSIERVQILNFYRPPLRGQDAPGLRCQALAYGDWVYATRAAEPRARVAFQRTAVAVTGQQLEGFTPVLLENGQRGWMETKVMQAHQPSNYVPNLGHCHATLRSNGAASLAWTSQ